MAPAWKSSFELTAERAAELLPSGRIMWGLDGDQEIFTLYGVPYQPVTVLIAQDKDGSRILGWGEGGGRHQGLS